MPARKTTSTQGVLPGASGSKPWLADLPRDIDLLAAELLGDDGDSGSGERRPASPSADRISSTVRPAPSRRDEGVRDHPVWTTGTAGHLRITVDAGSPGRPRGRPRRRRRSRLFHDGGGPADLGRRDATNSGAGSPSAAAGPPPEPAPQPRARARRSRARPGEGEGDDPGGDPSGVSVLSSVVPRGEHETPFKAGRSEAPSFRVVG